MSTFQRLLSIAKFPAVFLTPFLVASGSWQLALLAPGRFRTDAWHTLVSLSFLAAGVLAIFMLTRTTLRRPAKIVLAGTFALVFLFLAFMSSLRSNCGDEQVYIGRQTHGQQVASCQ